MIKTAEGLEKWLSEISKAKMKDATQYETFEYESKEFDNIPTIIPRFLFHLNSQVRGVWDHLLRLSKEETTKDLRADLSEKIDSINTDFSDLKQVSIYNLSQQTLNHRSQIQDLMEKVQNIQKSQESSGTLELQNMLKGPNLSLFAEKSAAPASVNSQVDNQQKSNGGKDEEPKRLKTKRSPK